MILLDGFLVKLPIGLTKNSSRRIVDVISMTKKTRLKITNRLILYT